jgi:hypothetical protein
MAPDRPAGHRKTGNQPTQNASRPQSKAQTAKTGIKYTVFAGVQLIFRFTEMFDYMVGYHDIKTAVFKRKFRCFRQPKADPRHCKLMKHVNRKNFTIGQYRIQENAGGNAGTCPDIKNAKVLQGTVPGKQVPDFLSLAQPGLSIKDRVPSKLCRHRNMPFSALVIGVSVVQALITLAA